MIKNRADGIAQDNQCETQHQDGTTFGLDHLEVSAHHNSYAEKCQPRKYWMGVINKNSQNEIGE